MDQPEKGSSGHRSIRDPDPSKWISVLETPNSSHIAGSDIASQHSSSDTDRGEEIDSSNCVSVAESGESDVSSLIDDNSVDSVSDERALVDLRTLLARSQRRRQEVRLPLFECDSASVEGFAPRAGCDRTGSAVLESSEEESYFSKLREQNFEKIRKMSCHQDVAGADVPERKGEEDEGDGSGAPRVVVLRHPLNDILGKGQPKDDAKYSIPESCAGGGKRNHTDVSPVAVSPEKEAQRPSRKSRNSQVVGHRTKTPMDQKKDEASYEGASRHAGDGNSRTGACGSEFSEKVMQLLSSDSRQELTAALIDRLLKDERNPKNYEAACMAKHPENLNTLFAVEGYNPPVESNVRVIHDTKWSMGVELRNEFSEINGIVVHGEGFNHEVSMKLLGCQKQLVFESVIGQANRDKARDHLTDLMHAINLGKKNLVAENYERLMYCLFMQECTDVLANGKLIMTNQVKHAPPDRCDDRGRSETGDEERYGIRNQVPVGQYGDRPVDSLGARQGERHGADVGSRHSGRSHADNATSGNEDRSFRRTESNAHRRGSMAMGGAMPRKPIEEMVGRS